MTSELVVVLIPPTKTVLAFGEFVSVGFQRVDRV